MAAGKSNSDTPKAPMPIVWRYTCSIQFLKDRYQFEKSEDTSVSWAAFAQKLGLGLPLLKMLIAKKRQFTIAQTHRIAARLKLSYEEQAYFAALIQHAQSSEPEEQAFFRRQLDEMSATKGQAPSEQRVTMSPSFLNQDWFVPALIVYLLDVAEIQTKGLAGERRLEIAKQLHTSEEVIEQLLQRLTSLGVLKEQNGTVMVTLDEIKSSVSGRRIVRKITEESLTQMQSNYGNADSFYYASAVSLLDDEVVAYREALKELFRSFSSKPRKSGEGLRVFQFVNHLWPVSFG